MTDSLLDDLEALIRRDPAMRGLISSEANYGRLCEGHFAGAAKSLAEPAGSVAIVTGFFVPGADRPAAETDGPPGAVRLALALEAVGHRVVLITDAWCASAVQTAAEVMEFPRRFVQMAPEMTNADAIGEWFSCSEFARELTHLISLERAGPSHTEESLRKQYGDQAPIVEFREKVPPESRGRCHNMRGEIIEAWTGGLHWLFDWIAEHRRDVCTIGIGDGGNEIGMGSVRWDDIARRLWGPQAPRIPCRIATDWNLIAGVSNWGGYALAAAVLTLCGREDVIAPWTCEREREILEHLIAHGPAVDGVTRLSEPTVDGLPFLTYIQTWAALRHQLGFAD